MAKRTILHLKDTEQLDLEIIARSGKSEARLVERAKVILCWHEGLSFKETASRLNLSEMLVNKWRQRYSKKGLDGLYDAPRVGRPVNIKAEVKARVIQLASTSGDKGYTNNSQRRIASKVGISQSKVHQILKQADLKPHQLKYWCGKSTDPEFEEKMMAIVGLYLDPPHNALVLCVDEKTQMQALDRTQPLLPLKTGLPKRITSTYKRNGTVSLIAALAVHSGEITGKTMEKNDAVNFLKFLKLLKRKYSKQNLYIIVDNLSIHKQKDVMNWVASQKNVHLFNTPTYSSWLNQIEIWFNMLTKDVIKGGVWQSKKDMVTQILQYIKSYNKDRAKPFNWTYMGEKKIDRNNTK